MEILSETTGISIGLVIAIIALVGAGYKSLSKRISNNDERIDNLHENIVLLGSYNKNLQKQIDSHAEIHKQLDVKIESVRKEGIEIHKAVNEVSKNVGILQNSMQNIEAWLKEFTNKVDTYIAKK